MTAEELISEKCHNLESKSLQGHLVVIDKVAFEAVEMARKEEREKAIEALDIAIMTIFEKNNHSVSIEKLIDQFDKLLNE